MRNLIFVIWLLGYGLLIDIDQIVINHYHILINDLLRA